MDPPQVGVNYFPGISASSNNSNASSSSAASGGAASNSGAATPSGYHAYNAQGEYIEYVRTRPQIGVDSRQQMFDSRRVSAVNSDPSSVMASPITSADVETIPSTVWKSVIDSPTLGLDEGRGPIHMPGVGRSAAASPKMNIAGSSLGREDGIGDEEIREG